MFKIECGENDPYDYFPLKDGLKPSTVGLKKLPHHQENKKNQIFQFDEKFSLYRQNKVLLRDGALQRYYQRLSGLDLFPVLKFILTTLLKEHPDKFSFFSNTLFCHLTKETLHFDEKLNLIAQSTQLNTPYTDSLDALAAQVQEDLVVHHLSTDKDFSSAVHLFSPNGWSAEKAIGQSFDLIHTHVPRIDKIVPRPAQLLKGLIHSPHSLERVAAINFRTDSILNRHPDFKKDQPFTESDPRLFMRFERQTTTGFPEIQSFLFSIKTYFVDCDQRNKDQEKHQQILKAFLDNDPLVNGQKFISENRDQVLKWLQG